MKLSVILPCFNGAATIATQLEALTHQRWVDAWEVIVSNNGSTDESMAIVESYRDRLPNLRIVNAYIPPGPRLGVPHSYNIGVKAATGDAFVFCEADDEVAPNWLAAMGAALCYHDFVACRLDYYRLNEPWRLEGFEGVQTNELCQATFSPYLPYASGCSFGLRRSVYETIGEFNTSFPCSYDTEYCWRAQYAGIQIHFVPNAVIYYRLRHGLKAIYRQSHNWGKDFTQLRKYFRSRMGRLAPLKMLLELLLMLPSGLVMFVLMWLQALPSRGKLAIWVWNLGFHVGILQGLLKKLPASLSSKPLESTSAPQVLVQTSR